MLSLRDLLGHQLTRLKDEVNSLALYLPPTALAIDEQCLDGNRLGFYAGFPGTPGNPFSAVYVAELPNGR